MAASASAGHTHLIYASKVSCVMLRRYSLCHSNVVCPFELMHTQNKLSKLFSFRISLSDFYGPNLAQLNFCFCLYYCDIIICR